MFPISGERAQMWLSSTSDSICNSLDSNCAKILSESESSMTYEELLDSNNEIKLNSSEENSIELFISGVTASHDLADLTVSNFLWKVYCCKEGEWQGIIRVTILFATLRWDHREGVWPGHQLWGGLLWGGGLGDKYRSWPGHKLYSRHNGWWGPSSSCPSDLSEIFNKLCCRPILLPGSELPTLGRSSH